MLVFAGRGRWYSMAVLDSWDRLCRLFVTRLVPCLRAGPRGGWERALLAPLLKQARRRWTFFYTVQGPRDGHRLRTRGSPWPTGELRAHLGPGVYAWKY